MSNEMKALVKAAPEQGLWLQMVPVPEPGPNEVLIKVRKSAICGTDVHVWNWDEWSAKTVPMPMVVGHEFCGQIVDCGPGAQKYKIGTRVSAKGHVVCGVCRNCRAGCCQLCRNTESIGFNRLGSFVKYVCLPEHNVVPIPDDIPDEIAALLDPLGNVGHTAPSFDLVGEDVLVTGAGPIGIMGALAAQKIGARKVVIIDINPYRLQLAKQMGVQSVVDVSKISLRDVMGDIGMSEGFDVRLKMSGATPAMRQMIERINNGGKLALLGIAPTEFAVNWNTVIFNMLEIKGIYGREIFETWYKMIAFVQSGLDISGLITHQISIEDYREGFAAMT